jgi:hypothetical protein
LARNLQHDSYYSKIRDGVVVCAVPCEPFSPNSLFNREKTGNFYVFGAEIHQNPPDLPVVKGFQRNSPKNGTGNNREISGKSGQNFHLAIGQILGQTREFSLPHGQNY